MTYFPIGAMFKSNKTGQVAIMKDTLGLDYQLFVLNKDGNKSRNRWVSHEKLETNWTEITSEEYWA